MSFQVKDSTITFRWSIAPNASPPAKADFDITLVLPNGTVTYVDDGITTYIAPTATAQGHATYDLTLTTVGLYHLYLSTGIGNAHIISAHREIYSVIAPNYVLNGTPAKIIQGPEIIPPSGPVILTINTAVEPDPLKSIYIEVENNNPAGQWISDDGLHAYTARNSVEFVWQYDMSTPYNLGTGVLAQSVAYDGIGGAQSYRAWNFRNDGLKMWILTNTEIFGYTMSVAWDISTLTPDQTSYNLDNDQNNNGSVGVHASAFFKDDGTELYVLWVGNPIGDVNIGTWTMSIAWDITTLSFVSKTADIWNVQGFSPFAGHMTTDGRYWVFQDYAAKILWQYDLLIPFDQSTLSYSGLQWDYGTNMPSIGGFIEGFYISPAADAIYMIDTSANDNYIQADIL